MYGEVRAILRNVGVLKACLCTNSNGNYISWETAGETNNKQFIIKRSADGINFEPLTTFPAATNPNQQNKYSYLDIDPLYPVSYYKLEQEDIDGNKKQLGIRKISRPQVNELTLNVQPSGSGLVIKIRSGSRSNVILRIYDTQGKQHKYEVLYNLDGLTTRNVSLPPGIYICEIKNEQGKKVASRVLLLK